MADQAGCPLFGDEGDCIIRLGISTCLLGEEVRYDGGHKHDRYLTDTLGQWVEWVPLCPEVEIGLGTPRPAMRLVAAGVGPRLVVRKTGELGGYRWGFTRKRALLQREAKDRGGSESLVPR